MTTTLELYRICPVPLSGLPLNCPPSTRMHEAACEISVM